MTFVSRRIRHSVILILFSLIITVLLKHFGTPLYWVQILSGWLLMTLLLLLLIYSLRKKLTLLPIGKTSSWLQFHAYSGLLSLLIFFQHIAYHLPQGLFETLLASLFLLTAFSGIIGMIFSRIIPKYLTRRGEEVIYERIPLFRYQLRKQAQALVIECSSETQSTALADYYKNQLDAFFYQPKKITSHLYGSMSYLYVLQTRHNNSSAPLPTL